MKKHFILPTLTLLLAACAAGPDYKTPGLPDILGWQRSDSTDAVTASDASIDTAWWKTLNDSVLNTLIEEAAAHNHDIRIALANLDEARALRRIEASAFYPSVQAGATAERVRHGGTAGNFDMALDAAWEPDIFGRVRRATEAAEARIAASQADYHDVMLSVLAEVARNYFELRGTQKRIAAARETVNVLKEVENVAENRLRYGATSEFDLTQARGEREITAAAIPNLEADMTAGTYRLSVLTGKTPEHYTELLSQSAPLPMPPDTVPIGLKSDLLLRRPDVRRAERTLAAATADIGVATAELFPRFPLTGSIGSAATRFGDFFASGGFTYIAAQSLVAPLFEGGRLRAQIDAANAQQKEALAMYEKTVITALEDAESALARYGKEWETLINLRAALDTRREAAKIARLRYESGTENFLVVLDAERSRIAAQDAVVQSETRILTRLTQLYKALGGGWEEFMLPTP